VGLDSFSELRDRNSHACGGFVVASTPKRTILLGNARDATQGVVAGIYLPHAVKAQARKIPHKERHFLCGIDDVFVPMQWEGYSSASQTVSELSAIGAPTRSLWVPLGIVYTCWWPPSGGASGRRLVGTVPLRVAGGLLVAYGAIGVAWPPMPST
jgi:hypothetical protein